MGITVFVEGGGDTRAQQARARQAFTKLFQKAGLKGRMPAIQACGGRSNTIRDFGIEANRGYPAVLLVDSETPVDAPTPSGHLKRRNEWQGSEDDERIHLMVQVMESWFFTQPEVLEQSFGLTLAQKSPIEKTEKKNIYDLLDSAAKKAGKISYTSRKQWGFEILERLEVGPIEAASPHAKRFFDYLRSQGPSGSV